MSELLVLGEEDVRASLPLDELAGSLTKALISLAEGAVSVPPRIAARTAMGLLGAMPGFVPDLGLAAKLVSVYPDNPRAGRPAHQALIALFDPVTGVPVAVMDGTYITAMRTAMTVALAARALAGTRRRSLAVIGAGVQGEAHVEAFSHLLAPGDIRVASRRASSAAALAGRYPHAVAMGSIRDAVLGADMVCCCTDAPEAVLDDGWIAPGTFVSSVGSGPELPAGLLARARLFVESRSATLPPPAGAVELQGCDPASLTEIGAVLSGRVPARHGDGDVTDVTVFKSTGHAVEDVAAAAVVAERARRSGAGVRVRMSAAEHPGVPPAAPDRREDLPPG